MPSRNLNNETYVINLCDETLGMVALRQHRFDFLRGDARTGKARNEAAGGRLLPRAAPRC